MAVLSSTLAHLSQFRKASGSSISPPQDLHEICLGAVSCIITFSIHAGISEAG